MENSTVKSKSIQKLSDLKSEFKLLQIENNTHLKKINSLEEKILNLKIEIAAYNNMQNEIYENEIRIRELEIIAAKLSFIKAIACSALVGVIVEFLVH